MEKTILNGKNFIISNFPMETDNNGVFRFTDLKSKKSYRKIMNKE